MYLRLIHCGSLVVLLAALLGAGCGSSSRLRYETAQEAFERGRALYERGKYERAAEYFQAVFNFGRSNEWADDAQLYLARAYRANKDYILATNEYTRFLEIYRTDERAEEAEYERALTYYARSPRYELDQTDTRRAVEYLQLFISRYPESPHVAEVERLRTELIEKMARKQYEAAKLYERRELFEAAALTYRGVFEQYPETAYADDALLGAIGAFIAFADQSVSGRQAERLRLAIATYEQLVQLFPQSPLLKEAEALYEQAQARLRGLEGGTL